MSNLTLLKLPPSVNRTDNFQLPALISIGIIRWEMEAVLQFLGALCLVLVVIAIGGFIYVRYRFRKLSKELIENVVNMGGTLPPISISLEPIESIPWPDTAKVDATIRQLREFGFEEVGSYFITNLPNTYVLGMADPVRNYWAALTTHPAAHLIVDLACEDQNGKHLNVADSGHEPNRDNESEQIIRLPGATVGTLYTTLQQHRPENIQEIILTEFPQYFELVYRRSMERRYITGEISVDHIDFVEELTQSQVDPATLEFLKQSNLLPKPDDRDIIIEELQERVTAKWWEKFGDRLLVITDQMEPLEIVEAMESNWDGWNTKGGLERDADRLAPKKGRELFWSLVNTLDHNEQFQIHESVETPIPADIIIGPEWTDY